MDTLTDLQTESHSSAVSVELDLEKMLTPEELGSFRERATAEGRTVAEHFQVLALGGWVAVPRVPLLGAAVKH